MFPIFCILIFSDWPRHIAFFPHTNEDHKGNEKYTSWAFSFQFINKLYYAVIVKYNNNSSQLCSSIITSIEPTYPKGDQNLVSGSRYSPSVNNQSDRRTLPTNEGQDGRPRITTLDLHHSLRDLVSSLLLLIRWVTICIRWMIWFNGLSDISVNSMQKGYFFIIPQTNLIIWYFYIYFQNIFKGYVV